MVRKLPPVSRETLYEEVWTQPVVKLAPKYGLSDVGLLKILRKLRIPVPGRGYWAKVKAGQTPAKKPLPDLPRGSWAPRGPSPLSEEQLAARRRRANALQRMQNLGSMVIVPDVLEDPLPLIREASTRLRRRDGWDHPAGIRSAPKEVLDIQVTRNQLERALLLMDTILKALATLGFTVRIDTERGFTILDGGGTTQSIALVELVSRARHEPTRREIQARNRYYDHARLSGAIPYPHIPQYDYTATGRLTLQLMPYRPGRNWNDTDRRKLESRLPRVIAEIVEITEKRRLQEAEQARRERACADALAKYNAQVETTQREWSQLRSMLRDARRHQRANVLREYLAALETHANQSGSMTPEHAELIRWGRAKADWLDPVLDRSDPILDAPAPQRPSYWGF